MQRWKCTQCHIIITDGGLDEGKCPQCKSEYYLIGMCPNDHNDCGHDIVDGLAYCDICGDAVCPVCGCHDVSQVSRVTGYLQDVAGWNQGKQQELADRHRTPNSELKGSK